MCSHRYNSEICGIKLKKKMLYLRVNGSEIQCVEHHVYD